MDGTLFDTERIYVLCWEKVSKEWGIDVPIEFIKDFMGSPRKEIERRFKERFGKDFNFEKFRQETVANVLEIFKKQGIPIKKGAEKLLKYLNEKNIPCAIATSTHKERVDLMLKMSGFDKYIDAVVCGNEIENGKPAPDIFIEAAKRIKKAANECIGVEDSKNGILALKASGMIAVLVPDMQDVTDEMRTSSDYIFNDLEEVYEKVKGLL